jgi:glucosamine 6-phosphate synthetase-like amidotransferase/phosphosugar isomerase protein
MCGIVGILEKKPSAGQIFEALRRLEISRYDSAGIAILENGSAKRLRARAHRSAFDRGRCRLRASLSRGAVVPRRSVDSSSRNRERPPILWQRFVIARRKLQHTLAIVNVPQSTIAREVEAVLHTYARPEIGVASTKAFTCQLTVLAALANAAGGVGCP